ncbi:ABC transporter ATP-binding protein [Pseudonocardia sp. KRD-184]|uniref:ABC transporter ATP-binding protein n=1 Tax=Pseudonocardia oceani TaxID=2792013 RepID=A0ABS6U4J9_9PSEU|nr:ABC transporter ATP-binding protein [Pseudonocardia oceani]MBW0093602.1 ABC transporter ATP-binding protein [Pseudonocardia oceani]MBW0100257.1 ABC transporter ATP-binding protein [Pseudonocardia oceani]MBW0113013.1 ABC transporter ATP-binding protein [Pseudonocardia oceani]MBW0125861.1 ABC transporter ATP-binding protein [Pseudonocardia oceani]MBW0127175.1 ABC transporter ATP-binding protein [Pseudonocardia oceani]
MAVIEVQDLHKRYRDHVAVHDVSFTVEEGEVFGVLGPNGAGKTTTVECVGGLRRPDGGRISVCGLDPRRDRAAVRELLGIQLQASELPDKLRVREAVELFASFYPAPADPGTLIERWGLADRRETPFAQLSGGQKQRLSIVLALVGNPRVAILDELTTGLDPQARRDTWDAIEQIRDSGVTVVLVTHFMEEAERLCDRLAVIDGGRVVALDTPSGLVAALPAGQTLRFRADVDEAVLTALPQVRTVVRRGARIEVTGHGDLLTAVTSALAAHGVVPVDLRLEQADLDDAFLALTGTKGTR